MVGGAKRDHSLALSRTRRCATMPTAARGSMPSKRQSTRCVCSRAARRRPAGRPGCHSTQRVGAAEGRPCSPSEARHHRGRGVVPLASSYCTRAWLRRRKDGTTNQPAADDRREDGYQPGGTSSCTRDARNALQAQRVAEAMFSLKISSPPHLRDGRPARPRRECNIRVHHRLARGVLEERRHDWDHRCAAGWPGRAIASRAASTPLVLLAQVRSLASGSAPLWAPWRARTVT